MGQPQDQSILQQQQAGQQALGSQQHQTQQQAQNSQQNQQQAPQGVTVTVGTPIVTSQHLQQPTLDVVCAPKVVR